MLGAFRIPWEKMMPRRPDVPCASCGKLMWRGSTSLPSGQATCLGCRRVGLGPTALQTRSCEFCGKDVTRHPRDFGDRAFCSSSCSNARNARWTGHVSSWRRVCEVCSVSYDATWTGQRTCGRTCGMKIHAGNLRAANRPKAEPPCCRVCGKVRAQGERWRSWCSNRCEARSRGDRILDLYRMTCERGMGGSRWRRVLVGYLRERDGSRCGICRRIILFDVRSGPSGSDRGASIDHIEPRSLGGSDDLSNLRLTHWGCNRKRKTGRADPPIQLALIG
jgi:endogenous inhibitor of DNA gyrase (YacG/DUF329 family)